MQRDHQLYFSRTYFCLSLSLCLSVLSPHTEQGVVAERLGEREASPSIAAKQVYDLQQEGIRRVEEGLTPFSLLICDDKE